MQFLHGSASDIWWLITTKIKENLSFDAVTLQSQESVTVGFKDVLKQVYEQPESYEQELFDIATGMLLPNSTIVGAHIFQHQWSKYLTTFTNLSNIDDPSNGLLLYKLVEWAFNRALLCVEITEGEMRFCLFCQELEDIKLVDKAVELWALGQHPSALPQEESNIKTTFGDLDGRPVFFPPSFKMQPSRRVLMLHATAS